MICKKPADFCKISIMNGFGFKGVKKLANLLRGRNTGLSQQASPLEEKAWFRGFWPRNAGHAFGPQAVFQKGAAKRLPFHLIRR